MTHASIRLSKEAAEFRATLDSETDRGCALMAAAYLSDQLERMFRAMFVDDANVTDELFHSVGPLGSFSSRIELAYALGQLPPIARRDLHLIRKIRNDFGHEAKPMSFNDSTLASRCRELQYNAREKEARPRAKFTSAVLAVCAVIHFRIETAVRRTVPDDSLLGDAQKIAVQESVTAMVEAAARAGKGVLTANLQDRFHDELLAMMQRLSRRG